MTGVTVLIMRGKASLHEDFLSWPRIELSLGNLVTYQNLFSK